MSRMADLAIRAENLVIEAMGVSGIMTDLDVLEYVNEHMPVYVDLAFVESVLDKYFGDDWYGGTDIYSYN